MKLKSINQNHIIYWNSFICHLHIFYLSLLCYSSVYLALGCVSSVLSFPNGTRRRCWNHHPLDWNALCSSYSHQLPGEMYANTNTPSLALAGLKLMCGWCRNNGNTSRLVRNLGIAEIQIEHFSRRLREFHFEAIDSFWMAYRDVYVRYVRSERYNIRFNYI